MGALVDAQTIGLQLEHVRTEVPLLYEQDDDFLGLILKEEDDAVSSRNMRVPIQVLAGGKGRQANPDGGDFGRGSGTTWDAFQLTPVFFTWAVEITKLTEYATNKDVKAVENVVKSEVKTNMKQFRKFLDSLLQGDGSNTLDTVVTVAGNLITVNNAAVFYDNQDLQVFPALGQASRGTMTIGSVDNVGKTLSVVNVPAGTQTGDLLVADGSSGVAGSGLFGIKFFQVNGNTGTIMGLNRATYPGKLSTPTVNFTNGALTQGGVRRMLQQVRTALGRDILNEDKFIFYMNTDMEAAWENVGIVVSQVIQNQLPGKASQDMLKYSAPATMAGRPVHVSIHAAKQRIDGLCLKNWGRAEMQPIDYLEFGGQTVFPVYGASGGLSGAQLFYFITGLQIFNSNVLCGTFGSNIAEPSGY